MAKSKKITNITYVNPQGEVVKEKLTGNTGGYKSSDLKSTPALSAVPQTVQPTVSMPDLKQPTNTIGFQTKEQDKLQSYPTVEQQPTSSNAQYYGLAAKTGLATGFSSIPQASLQETERALRKGEEIKTPLQAIGQVTQSIQNAVKTTPNYLGAAVNAIRTMKDIWLDKNKSALSKVGATGVAAVNQAGKLTGTDMSTYANTSLPLVGALNPNLDEKVADVREIIGKPAKDLQQEFAEQSQGKSATTQMIGQGIQAFTNMVPSLTATVATRNPDIGLMTMLNNAKGQATQEALDKGASLNDAIDIGNAKAYVEYATEKISGVADIFGKGGLDDVIDKAANKYLKNQLANFFAKKGIGVTGEVAEEIMSDVLGTLIDVGTLEPNKKYTLDDLKATVGPTIISTVLMNLISGGFGPNAYRQNAAQLNAINNQNVQENVANATQDNIQHTQNEVAQQQVTQDVTSQELTQQVTPQQETVRNENIAEQRQEPVIKTKEFKQAQEMVKQGTATEKERSLIKTATEAQNTQEITAQMEDTAKNYEVQGNEQTLMQAEAKLKGIKTLEEKAKYVSDILKSDKRLNASDMAAAELVLKDAAAAKNAKVYNEVLADLSIYATEQGQSIQALSMIRKLSPTSQLDVLEKIINREKASGNKAYRNVEVTEEMKNRIFDCYDENGKVNQEQFDQTMEEIKQELANEIKVSAGDKVRAWRYLSMLGNPKTHVRNVVANVAMNTVKMIKDTVSGVGQDLFIREKSNKTATLKRASSEVKNLTNEVYDQVSEDTFGNKYNEKSELEDMSKVFKTRWLESFRKFNDRALSKEDQYFKKLNFKRSFSNYLTAQGISTQADIQNNPQIVQKAKLFAIEEANVATFNQQNRLAQFINSGDKKLGPAYKVIRGAIIPFTRTPLNIAKTGIEYTPGFGMLTLANEVSKAPKSMKGTVFIDGLSKQITGSALALVGYALAKSGRVTAGTDKDKEGYFETDQGSAMDYSIKLGDTSYDLSWLSPSSMPFFVGARMFEVLDKQEGINENLILESLASTLDPLSEMSCISSFTKVLKSYSQEGGGAIKDIGVSTMQNYLSQFIPTVAGQVARFFDDTKRTTMADKNAPNKITQETLRTLAYKFPGTRNLLPASTDYFGEEKKEYNEGLIEKATGKENFIDKLYNAFVSPVNKRRDTMTKEGKEIIRVARKTGNDDIIPSALSKTQSIKYNDNEYSMTIKEYNEYKKDFGNTFLDNVKEMMNTDEYENASDEEKAQMLSGIMKYSKDKAKDNFLTEQGEDYSSTSDNIDDFVGNDMSISDYYALKVSSTVKVGEGTTSIVNGQNAKKNIALVDAFDMDAADYLTYSYEINQIKADKDANGKSINGSAKRKKIEYIQSLPLSATQKQMLYSLKVDGTKNKKTNSQVIQMIENSDLSAEEKQELYNYIYK